MRRKTQHFAAYDEVVKKFCKLIDIDPWMVNSYFARTSGFSLAMSNACVCALRSMLFNSVISDVDDTIKQTADHAGQLRLSFRRPRRNEPSSD